MSWDLVSKFNARAKELGEKMTTMVREAGEAGLTPEQDAEFDAMAKDCDKFRSQAETALRAVRAEAEAREAIEAERELEPSRVGKPQESRKEKLSADEIVEQRKKATDLAIREGFQALDDGQRAHLQRASVNTRTGKISLEGRTLTVANDTGLGMLIPVEAMGPVRMAQKAFGGLRSIAQVVNTPHGREMSWPGFDDTGNVGSIIGEAKTASAGTEPAGKEVSIGSWTYTANELKVSTDFLRDYPGDIGTWLLRLMAERIERGLAVDYTTRTKPGGPQGLVPAVGVGVTAASATTITYQEWVEMEHSIDASLRSQSSWCMSDEALLDARKLVNGDGVPLWNLGLAGGAPSTILNHPYTINIQHDAPAAGKKPVTFGDHSQFLIRDIGTPVLIRLNELYAKDQQVGFLMFSAHDSKYLATHIAANSSHHPIRALKMAAS